MNPPGTTKCNHVSEKMGFPLDVPEGKRWYMKCQICGRSYPKLFKHEDQHLPLQELPETLPEISGTTTSM